MSVREQNISKAAFLATVARTYFSDEGWSRETK